ncbi:GlxA family transcriptional regulator [Nocardia seriolae]|uniref:AraC family transcriptional regulator n=1 Tax=Nocardia seriolae TaxID=37332 RepID=A0A0B8NCQ0_9NOCA|nr:GlxA family transcriptional regulator [Nocardia seriolae]MTJ61449.1 helix-turn-helix domain-containing protein [Nocardia seriolae]MTJ71698.1 helix-turn-helix domain-containing protein [Nocardia seriolae]MTJ86481.1 helix-turn-helix domain-containing protein [Nocardia seriolae]MTK30475.1 helix-turn-helix domain-containing protein [Nocardia seriolae]MTK39421.1 helix-turn-helix domain-containing protein [Nocardia seriolae]
MRVVLIVVFDGFQLTDLAGPADVFTGAAALGADPGYRVELAAAQAGPVRSSSGIEVTAAHGLDTWDGPVDTLLVVGGLTVFTAMDDSALVAGVGRVAAQAARLGSVCSGTFLLARAGLLDGRRVTTHWSGGELLARRFPAVTTEPDRIYVRDGRIWTSAGVTAGIDLALAIVAADHGPELAREVARWMVVYLHRPGGQSQFSAPLAADPPKRDSLRALQVWMEENLTSDLSMPALATQVGMSTRHFSRVFAGETGTTPARYVEQVRIAAARRMLETTDQPMDRVAAAVGLGSPETLYRIFHRHLGIPPGEYRARFTKF